MYSFHLFLISSASTRFLTFMSFIVPIFGQKVLLISPIFLKRSLVFPLLFFFFFFLLVLYTVPLKMASLSLHALLRKSVFSWIYLSLSPLLFASLLSSAIYKASSDKHFAFLLFFFIGMVFFTAFYTLLWISIHSSSGTLFARSNLLKVFLTSSAYSYRV